MAVPGGWVSLKRVGKYCKWKVESWRCFGCDSLTFHILFPLFLQYFLQTFVKKTSLTENDHDRHHNTINLKP